MNHSWISIIRSLRLSHWTKNLFVFAVILFAPAMTQTGLLFKSAIAFLCFSLTSSSVYLINDLADIHDDRHHPVKSHRPIAAGHLSPAIAWVMIFILQALSLAIAGWLHPGLCLLLLGYSILQLIYSYLLKTIILVDVFVIAVGFLMRVFAGSLVTGLPISHWLLLCTFLLALFLGFSKRRSELQLSHSQGHQQRHVLQHYSIIFLDQIIAIVTTLVIITYLMYTLSNTTTNRFQSINLVYTTPLVLYGIFRYLYLIYTSHKGENPEQNIIMDKALLFTVLFWFLSVCYIIYH